MGKQQQQRQLGTVANIRADKGFGFIKTDSGPEFFFHYSGCTACKFDELFKGQRVSFVPGDGKGKGPRAEEIGLA